MQLHLLPPRHLLDGFIFPSASHRIWRASSFHPWLIPHALQRQKREKRNKGTEETLEATFQKSCIFAAGVFVRHASKEHQVPSQRLIWFDANITAGC